MSRISANVPPIDSLDRLRQYLTDQMRAISRQVNGLTEGRIAVRHGALGSPPTIGDYAIGDFVPNASVQELGAVGSKYMVMGWYCVAGGSPGTWKEAQVKTGG